MGGKTKKTKIAATPPPNHISARVSCCFCHARSSGRCCFECTSSRHLGGQLSDSGLNLVAVPQLFPARHSAAAHVHACAHEPASLRVFLLQRQLQVSSCGACTMYRDLLVAMGSSPRDILIGSARHCMRQQCPQET